MRRHPSRRPGRHTPRVLREAADVLHLTPPLHVHPLIGRITPDDEPGVVRMDTFIPTDTVVIPRFVASHPGAYDLCDVAPSGACVTAPGGVSIVLSEILDANPEGLRVVLMLMDRRSRANVQQFYGVWLQSRFGKWRAVRFERL